MKQGRQQHISKDCYRHAEVLASILADALRLEKEADKINKEIVAGGITRESTIKKQEEWKLKKRNLDKRKVNVLDSVIFPSMANLTVLLEAMAESGFIERMFEADLKSLFFSKSRAFSVKSRVAEERYKASRGIFARFTDACCKTVLQKLDKDGKIGNILLDESRLILCDIMQESVYRAILAIAPFKYEDLDFLQKTLYTDMDRLHAWTTMLARGASKELSFDEDRRPALF